MPPRPLPPNFVQAGMNQNPQYPQMGQSPDIGAMFQAGTQQSPWMAPQPNWSRPLGSDEKRRIDEYRAFLDDAHVKALKNNPNLPPATLDELNKLKQFQIEGFEGQLRLPDTQSRKLWLTARNSDYNRNHFDGLTPDRKAAAHLLGNEMRGPSIFGGIISNVYDEKNGGIQWGGIAGATLGGLLGSQLAGATGLGEWLGGWMAPVVMAIGAALGSWGGRVATDYISSAMKPKAQDGAAKEQVKTPQVAQQQQVDAPSSEPARLAAAAEQAKQQPTNTQPVPIDPRNPNPGLSSEVNRPADAARPR